MTIKAPAVSNISVTDSYKKAVSRCQERVSWIKEHYGSRNQRFRDREFDVEKDHLRCLYYYGQAYDTTGGPKDMLRVTQIFEDPQFDPEAAKTSDLVQGDLDNCWFISALSMVASKPELMKKICIAHDKNVGVYGFVFFKNGQWIDVVIDDILPVKVAPWDILKPQEKAIYHNNRDNYNKIARKGEKILSFASAVKEGVTLFSLVEKAFAKAHGDYGSLNEGYCHEGIEDLTGGVAITIATKDIMDPIKFWDELKNLNKDRMFGCSVDYSGNGLRGSHAYAITDVHEVQDNGQLRRFVRIRNPWGRSEWTGRWSDGSKEWTKEWLGRLEELKHSFGDDGEFLMDYEDFLTTWHDIQRCILFDDTWEMSVTWINASVRPPPCNWSYGDVSFTVEAIKATPTIFVLSQVDSRYFRGSEYSNITWHMDFKVYRHSEEDVEDPKIVEESYPNHAGSRSVSVSFDLEPGKYVVHVRLDKTEQKNQAGEVPPANPDWGSAEGELEGAPSVGTTWNTSSGDNRKLSRAQAEAIRAIGFEDEMFHDNTYTHKSLAEMKCVSGFHGQPFAQIQNVVSKFSDKHCNKTATLGLRVYTKKGAEVKVEGQKRVDD